MSSGQRKSAAAAIIGTEIIPDAADRALFEAFQAHKAGQLEVAVAAYRRALLLRPKFVEALNNLGIALANLRRFEEALVIYREASALRPETPEIWNNIGDTLHSLGDRVGAIAHYRRAVELRPEYGTAWRNLGDALLETGRADESEECFQRAVALMPRVDANLSPAEVAIRESQLELAEVARGIEAAVSRDPLLAAAYRDVGRGVAPQDDSPESAARHRQAADLRFRHYAHLSGLVMRLHYDNAVPPEVMRDAHREIASLFAELPRYHAHPNNRDPERALRIGYVSGDYRNHSVAYFAKAMFAAHDRASFEVFAYSNSAVDDAYTEFFRTHCQGWRQIIEIGDAALVEMIRADGIDILVDLSGHTNGTRIGMFARRPAPVQVTWLGYPDTSGLSEIDYRFTDAIADPTVESDKLVSEILVRLPRGFHCYTAPGDAPDVATLPAESNGHITFGSFNTLLKVSGQTLDLWAAVLREVPDSRLFLKGRWLDSDDMRARVVGGFKRRGIGADRLELKARTSERGDHLAAYGRIDIALDTAPYSGVTTTCEALWMGVPVVTLAGARHAGRIGASLLIHAGLDELVASDAKQYVAIAARLASDRASLAELRRGLRARFAVSPVCDAAGFTRQLEAAYRTMWQAWCAKS